MSTSKTPRDWTDENRRVELLAEMLTEEEFERLDHEGVFDQWETMVANWRRADRQKAALAEIDMMERAAECTQTAACRTVEYLRVRKCSLEAHEVTL